MKTNNVQIGNISHTFNKHHNIILISVKWTESIMSGRTMITLSNDGIMINTYYSFIVKEGQTRIYNVIKNDVVSYMIEKFIEEKYINLVLNTIPVDNS